MSWSKLSDTILDHPKFRDLHDAGWSLFTRALVWSNKHRTEGHLPRTVVERLGKRAVVRELVARRIWELAGDGYAIHDFLDYNLDKHGTKPPPSPELRAARADAGRRGADRRWHGNGDGKRSHPADGKVPSAVAKLATPVFPSTRDPDKRRTRAASSTWTKAGALAEQLAATLEPPDEEPS